MQRRGCSSAGIIISVGNADRFKSRRQRVIRNMAWREIWWRMMWKEEVRGE